MDRRTFLGAVTGGLLAAPLASEGQQPGKVPRIGILVTANPRVYDDFVDQLRKLGYIEGRISPSIFGAPRETTTATRPLPSN